MTSSDLVSCPFLIKTIQFKEDSLVYLFCLPPSHHLLPFICHCHILKLLLVLQVDDQVVVAVVWEALWG